MNLSKTRNKEGSEVRHLQGEVRRLKKVIRSLESEIRALKKWEHNYHTKIESQDEEITSDSEDTHVVLKPRKPCEHCGKGFYVEFEIMDKIFGTCNVCQHRKRLK